LTGKNDAYVGVHHARVAIESAKETGATTAPEGGDCRSERSGNRETKANGTSASGAAHAFTTMPGRTPKDNRCGTARRRRDVSHNDATTPHGVCCPPMGFPTIRPRRLRATKELRALVRETSLAPSDFVYPMFFNAALDEPRPITSMPGISQEPMSAAAALAKTIYARGVRSVILFGLPKTKDARGASGLDPNGPVPRAIAEMKAAVPDLIVMADVCVDEYTDHGHCGILKRRRGPHHEEWEVDNLPIE
jgi:hypothetical protein